MIMCQLSPDFKKSFMHINDLDFKTFYSSSWKVLILLHVGAVKERDFGREEDEQAIPHPSTSWGSCEPA